MTSRDPRGQTRSNGTDTSFHRTYFYIVFVYASIQLSAARVVNKLDLPLLDLTLLVAFSALMLLVGGRKGIWPVKKLSGEILA